MSESDLIALASLISSIVALIVSILLLYDWNRIKKPRPGLQIFLKRAIINSTPSLSPQS